MGAAARGVIVGQHHTAANKDGTCPKSPHCNCHNSLLTTLEFNLHLIMITTISRKCGYN